MAERQPSWSDYTRAAFHFRVPLGRLGDIGVNYLCLAAGVIFAGLFGIAHNFRASLGVILLTSAFELAYLWFLTSLPRFRAMVRADVGASERSATHVSEAARLGRLSNAARGRRQRLVDICHEIEQRISDSLGESGRELNDVLNTGGFTELERIFTSLLSHYEELGQFLTSASLKALPGQVRDLQHELENKGLTAAVRTSREGTLRILMERVEHAKKAQEAYELCEAEMQRIEQQVELLRSKAVVEGDVSGLAGQVDDIVGGINETTEWITDSRRMWDGGETTEQSTTTTSAGGG